MRRYVFRMTAPLVASSLLLFFVGVGAAWYIQRLQHNVSEDLRANVSSVRAAEELEIAVREVRTRLHQYLMTGDPNLLAAALSFREEIERWLGEAERWGTAPRERVLLARVRRGQHRLFEELGPLSGQDLTEERRQKIRNLIDGLLKEEVLQPTHEFLDVNEKEAEQAMADNQVLTDRLVWGLLLLGTCGSGAGVAAGVAVARGYRRSLIQLSVPIRAAAGHLEEVVGPVTVAAGSDLHELEGDLRLIADQIEQVIARLRRSEREALRAEQLAAVGQMAAGMAHELRNPLTSMKILVQAAQDNATATAGDYAQSAAGPLPALDGRDLAVLEEEITRLDGLTQMFLDYARPPRPEQRSVDLRSQVDQVLALVASRAAPAGVRLVFEPPVQPAMATVDPGQFRQVLLNLLVNALDATPSGGCITIALASESGGGQLLRVSDTGCGLPAVLGSQIFAPFVTTKETGLGLGLSICKRIAEAHGGTLEAEDCASGGAVFTFRLPP
jgi:signal transduction histidine kinase